MHSSDLLQGQNYSGLREILEICCSWQFSKSEIAFNRVYAFFWNGWFYTADHTFIQTCFPSSHFLPFFSPSSFLSLLQLPLSPSIFLRCITLSSPSFALSWMKSHFGAWLENDAATYRVPPSVAREERRGGREQEEKKLRRSSGSLGGAVAMMGELSNAPLSKLPRKHCVTTRD